MLRLHLRHIDDLDELIAAMDEQNRRHAHPVCVLTRLG
jgi:hypothetical protein